MQQQQQYSDCRNKKEQMIFRKGYDEIEEWCQTIQDREIVNLCLTFTSESQICNSLSFALGSYLESQKQSLKYITISFEGTRISDEDVDTIMNIISSLDNIKKISLSFRFCCLSKYSILKIINELSQLEKLFELSIDLSGNHHVAQIDISSLFLIPIKIFKLKLECCSLINTSLMLGQQQQQQQIQQINPQVEQIQVQEIENDLNASQEGLQQEKSNIFPIECIPQIQEQQLLQDDIQQIGVEIKKQDEQQQQQQQSSVQQLQESKEQPQQQQSLPQPKQQKQLRMCNKMCLDFRDNNKLQGEQVLKQIRQLIVENYSSMQRLIIKGINSNSISSEYILQFMLTTQLIYDIKIIKPLIVQKVLFENFLRLISTATRQMKNNNKRTTLMSSFSAVSQFDSTKDFTLKFNHSSNSLSNKKSKYLSKKKQQLIDNSSSNMSSFDCKSIQERQLREFYGDAVELAYASHNQMIASESICLNFPCLQANENSVKQLEELCTQIAEQIKNSLILGNHKYNNQSNINTSGPHVAKRINGDLNPTLSLSKSSQSSLNLDNQCNWYINKLEKALRLSISQDLTISISFDEWIQDQDLINRIISLVLILVDTITKYIKVFKLYISMNKGIPPLQFQSVLLKHSFKTPSIQTNISQIFSASPCYFHLNNNSSVNSYTNYMSNNNCNLSNYLQQQQQQQSNQQQSQLKNSFYSQNSSYIPHNNPYSQYNSNNNNSTNQIKNNSNLFLSSNNSNINCSNNVININSNLNIYHLSLIDCAYIVCGRDIIQLIQAILSSKFDQINISYDYKSDCIVQRISYLLTNVYQYIDYENSIISFFPQHQLSKLTLDPSLVKQFQEEYKDRGNLIHSKRVKYFPCPCMDGVSVLEIEAQLDKENEIISNSNNDNIIEEENDNNDNTFLEDDDNSQIDFSQQQQQNLSQLDIHDIDLNSIFKSKSSKKKVKKQVSSDQVLNSNINQQLLLEQPLNGENIIDPSNVVQPQSLQPKKKSSKKKAPSQSNNNNNNTNEITNKINPEKNNNEQATGGDGQGDIGEQTNTTDNLTFIQSTQPKKSAKKKSKKPQVNSEKKVEEGEIQQQQQADNQENNKFPLLQQQDHFQGERENKIVSEQQQLLLGESTKIQNQSNEQKCDLEAQNLGQIQGGEKLPLPTPKKKRCPSNNSGQTRRKQIKNDQSQKQSETKTNQSNSIQSDKINENEGGNLESELKTDIDENIQTENELKQEIDMKGENQEQDELKQETLLDKQQKEESSNFDEKKKKVKRIFSQEERKIRQTEKYKKHQEREQKKLEKQQQKEEKDRQKEEREKEKELKKKDYKPKKRSSCKKDQGDSEQDQTGKDFQQQESSFIKQSDYEQIQSEQLHSQQSLQQSASEKQKEEPRIKKGQNKSEQIQLEAQSEGESSELDNKKSISANQQKNEGLDKQSSKNENIQNLNQDNLEENLKEEELALMDEDVEEIVGVVLEECELEDNNSQQQQQNDQYDSQNQQPSEIKQSSASEQLDSQS